MLPTDHLHIGVIGDKYILYYGEAMARMSLDLYHIMGKPMHIRKSDIELTYNMYLYVGTILGYTYTSDYKIFSSVVKQIECDVETILESYDIVKDWGKLQTFEDVHFKGATDTTIHTLHNKLFDTTIEVNNDILQRSKLIAGFEWE